MEYQNYRISKLRDYLFNVINSLTENRNYQISADFLGEIDDFSLDKIPIEKNVEKWVTGTEIKREVFSFKSRREYSQDTINNLKNIGFFEDFENIINSNSKKGILPEIPNIQSIECLNPGTLNNVDGTRAIFDIQVEIIYLEKTKRMEISL